MHFWAVVCYWGVSDRYNNNVYILDNASRHSEGEENLRVPKNTQLATVERDRNIVYEETRTSSRTRTKPDGG